MIVSLRNDDEFGTQKRSSTSHPQCNLCNYGKTLESRESSSGPDFLQSEDNPDSQQLTLESVFVLHRHSIRSPTCYAPNFNEIHPKLYPRGTGYLTRQGIDICRHVGKLVVNV